MSLTTPQSLMQVEIIIKIHGKLWEALQVKVHDLAGLADLCTIVSRSLVRALEQFRGKPDEITVSQTTSQRGKFRIFRASHKEP